MTDHDHLIAMLNRLKLTALRDQLDSLIDEAGRRELTIRDALALFCEREIARRDQRRIDMSFGLARFPFVRDLTGLDFNAQPSIDKAQLREIATGWFIANDEAVLFLGPLGVGKTHLAVAIGREAIDAHIAALDQQVAAVDDQLAVLHKAIPISQLIAAIPGVGLLGAITLALSVEPENFASGRHFPAWLGLTPKEHSAGGKPRLGKISKAGNERLRQLLFVGAMSVIRFAKPGSKSASAWLLQLLARKPRNLAAVALANKMARIIWAMMSRAEAYRHQPVAA